MCRRELVSLIDTMPNTLIYPCCRICDVISWSYCDIYFVSRLVKIIFLTLPRHTFFFNQIRHYGSMWPETNFDCSPFSHECTDRPVKILTYILDILKRYPMIKKILKIINMLNKIREKNFFFEKMFYEKICIFLNF